MTTFRICGRVIDRQTRYGVVGLRVEAWDKDLICNDLVGTANTNSQGTFRIEFNESYFRDLFLDRQPDLFFKVFHEDELIKSTEDLVLWNVSTGDTEVSIEVDVEICPAKTQTGKDEDYMPQQPVREAPITPPFIRVKDDPTRPAVPNEPVLAIENIQGNILAGFNKDQQTLLFLKIQNANDFRRWLSELIPFIATTAEVLAFNRLFKEIRRRRGIETHTVQATWINIALSFAALQALAGDGLALQNSAREFPEYRKWADDLDVLKAEAFQEEAFKQGMQARSVDVLGDPRDAGDGEDPEAIEGNRNNWLFGGPGNEADVVVIVASDSAAELAAEVSRIEESIYSGRTRKGQHANSGVTIIYKQQGATLPPPLTGHEHFGFLDGVSQPGVRGRISEDEHDVFTLRQNSQDPEQGKPGQDLLWPGEFVFGYPGQDASAQEVKDEGVDSLTLKKRQDGKPSDERPAIGPVWAKDGSFLVIRRLRQDVAGFHEFLRSESKRLGLDEGQFGAKLVGRWKSGAPIMRAATKDNPKLAADDCANNHFEFHDESEPIPPVPDPNDSTCTQESAFCEDNKFEQSPSDRVGAICPFAAHIRKTYPRDDEGTLSDRIGEVSTQTHRLLRRGIPFGEPYYPPNDPDKTIDSGNRGLVFAAYQTSIEEQFEFVQSAWANNIDFKDKREGDAIASGHDLIIGQTNDGQGEGSNAHRQRRCRITVRNEAGELEHKEAIAPVDWVIPTGGGYFFAPSIDALCLLAGTKRTCS
jgi:Dyp-type peroxidase family